MIIDWSACLISLDSFLQLVGFRWHKLMADLSTCGHWKIGRIRYEDSSPAYSVPIN